MKVAASKLGNLPENIVKLLDSPFNLVVEQIVWPPHNSKAMRSSRFDDLRELKQQHETERGTLSGNLDHTDFAIARSIKGVCIRHSNWKTFMCGLNKDWY